MRAPARHSTTKTGYGVPDADEYHAHGELLPGERIGPPLAGAGRRAMRFGIIILNRARRWLGAARRSGDLAEVAAGRDRGRVGVDGSQDWTGACRVGGGHCFTTSQSRVDDKTGPRRTAPDPPTTGFDRDCRRFGYADKAGGAATDDSHSPTCGHRRRRAGPAIATNNCRSCRPLPDARRGRGPTP